MKYKIVVCSFVVVAFLLQLIHFSECKNYQFLIERAEIRYANDSFAKNVVFHLGKYNRTFVALNVSFDIVRDFTNQKLLGTIKVYQFFHNEYRFTGIQMTVDTCKIEKANIFSLKEQFKDAQFFINLCNIKKGAYKLVNFTPNPKYFPKYLPEGRMSSNIRLHDGQGSDFFSLDWYFEIKPMD